MSNQEKQEKLQSEIFHYLDNFSEMLVSIGHKKRIIILTHLLNGSKKFSFLEEKTNLKKTALAHHLNILSNSRMVNKIERGLYEISEDGREFILSIFKSYKSSSLRVLEIAKSLQERFFFDYWLDEKAKTHMKLVSSNPEFIPHAMTLIGAITGVLKAYGSKITVDELAGLTGHCFLTIVGQNKLWVTAPETHNLIDTFLMVLEKIGYKFSRYFDKDSFPLDSDFTRPLSFEDEKRARRLFTLIRKEVNEDKPVILWGIPVPEWGIVKGYKEENYIVSTFRQIQEKYENQIPYNKINAMGSINALFIENFYDRKDIEIDYKESIERAISIAKENKYGRSGHITGLEAYDRWRYLMENEEDEGTKYFGNAYLIQVFQAGKQSVTRFLRKINNQFKNMPQQISIEKAINEYQEIEKIYKELAELFPLAYGKILKQEKTKTGVELIQALKNHEDKGIRSLEQALAKWE